MTSSIMNVSPVPSTNKLNFLDEEPSKNLDFLRNMFGKINPYYISCLYKQTFENHAIGVLNSVQIVNDAFDSTDNQFAWYDDKGYTSSEYRDDLRPMFQSSLSELNTDGRTADRGQGGWDYNVGPSPWTTCSSLALNNPCKEIQLGDKCPDHETNLNEVDILSTKSSNVWPRSSLKSKRRVSSGSHNSRRSREQSAAMSSDQRSGSSEISDLQRVPSNHLSDSLSKNGRNPFKLGSGRVTPTYRFIYHPNSSFYIQQYREHYTDKSLRQAIMLSTEKLTTSAQLRLSQQGLPKATVECWDVRDGACIRPSSSNNLKEFCIDINKKIRSDSINRMPYYNSDSWHPKTPPRRAASPPRKWTSTSFKNSNSKIDSGYTPSTDQILHYSLDSIPGYSSKTNMNHNTKPSRNPIVSRSRPSIPSNARGIVCATAVETPVHVIPVNHITSSTGNIMLDLANNLEKLQSSLGMSEDGQGATAHSSQSTISASSNS